ncbi:hypothetical protein SDC9_153513 [bioreactor metagenome]|uniref:Uncharacterized protein n=1 Tax=bioreactor metagenome TaxID=1076179 RepID=A0A645EWK7_9ZZZZ
MCFQQRALKDRTQCQVVTGGENVAFGHQLAARQVEHVVSNGFVRHAATLVVHLPHLKRDNAKLVVNDGIGKVLVIGVKHLGEIIELFIGDVQAFCSVAGMLVVQGFVDLIDLRIIAVVRDIIPGVPVNGFLNGQAVVVGADHRP